MLVTPVETAMGPCFVLDPVCTLATSVVSTKHQRGCDVFSSSGLNMAK